MLWVLDGSLPSEGYDDDSSLPVLLEEAIRNRSVVFKEGVKHRIDILTLPYAESMGHGKTPDHCNRKRAKQFDQAGGIDDILATGKVGC